MKIYIFPFLLICSFAIAQKKSTDYSEKCDSTLILKKVIYEINDLFLKDLVNEYINNDLFFKETDLLLGKEEDLLKFKKHNLKIKSIMITEHDPIVIQKCQNALNFNNTYLKLFEIRKNVLSQKFDSVKVDQAIKEIDNLPLIMNNSKMFVNKDNIRTDLVKYLQTTCELKKELEVLIENPFQTPTHKQKYDILKNNKEFKKYSYLIDIIEKVKKDKTNYSKNDLQPCE